MTSLLPGTAGELAALRRRAYGPDADIHTDPVALARLRQLEDQVPAEDPAEPSAAAPKAERPLADVLPPIGDTGDRRQPAPGAEPPPEISAPAARPWWRRPAVLVAAAAVALVVVVASLIGTGGGRPDRTLTPTPAGEEISFPESYEWLPSVLGVSRDSLSSYRGVGDVIVWAGRSKDGVDCLLVTSTGGPFGFGCSRDGRDATADVVLDSDMGPIDSTGLPERSTLRFVYRGDRVDVWITEP